MPHHSKNYKAPPPPSIEVISSELGVSERTVQTILNWIEKDLNTRPDVPIPDDQDLLKIVEGVRELRSLCTCGRCNILTKLNALEPWKRWIARKILEQVSLQVSIIFQLHPIQCSYEEQDEMLSAVVDSLSVLLEQRKEEEEND